MAAKSHYELLELPPTATLDEIKRAFRLQIARYHPDKVQHLGKEFQDMAAERAAELTEAYRILSDEGRRAAYDQSRSAPGPDAAAAAPPAPPVARPGDAPRRRGPGPKTNQARLKVRSSRGATRDEFVRRRSSGARRWRRWARRLTGQAAVRSRAAPGAKMLAGAKGRVSSRDRVARGRLRRLRIRGCRASSGPARRVCVLLIGSTLGTAGEMARAIAEQRRKSRGAKATLIPVDARNWDAHLPTDAPDHAKTLLARVRSGT